MLFLLTSLLLAQHEHKHDSNLKISAAVDIVGGYKLNKESTAKDKTDVREAEIMLQSPIDDNFDGQVSFAAHQEKGQMIAELHEGFIETSKLVPRSNIKLGQYFLGVGILNKVHRHEWNIISAPQVHEKFFGKEGALDTGLEYHFLFPGSLYFNITAGITNGFTYGHSHDEGEKPHQPTHYARAGVLILNADLGVNYLSRTSADHIEMTLYGIDFQVNDEKYLFLSEFWLRKLKPHDAEGEDTFGFYVLPQIALGEKYFAGILYDYYTITTLKDATDKSISNSDQHIVPTFTVKPSDVTTFRLAYNHGISKKADTQIQDRKVELQVNFVIGHHQH